MSANNHLRIIKEHRKWFVLECDADTEEIIEKSDPLASLSEACKYANDYMQENLIEYGISWIDPIRRREE